MKCLSTNDGCHSLVMILIMIRSFLGKDDGDVHVDGGDGEDNGE